MMAAPHAGALAARPSVVRAARADHADLPRSFLRARGSALSRRMSEPPVAMR